MIELPYRFGGRGQEADASECVLSTLAGQMTFWDPGTRKIPCPSLPFMIHSLLQMNWSALGKYSLALCSL